MTEAVFLDGAVRLILGDCREVLPTLTGVDCIVTDPPYGISADSAACKNKGKWGWTYYGETNWDKDRPSKAVFDLIRASSRDQIIWGGNYFTDYLPPTMRWLIWDKGQRDFSLADFEMAWCSQHKAARLLQFSRAKALLDGKVHPTQKPVEVMKWCLSFVETGDKICDPFLGSGSTGVAAVKVGHPFIGIEIEPKYFDIAVRRIEQATHQPDLFIEQPKPVQTALFDGASA